MWAEGHWRLFANLPSNYGRHAWAADLEKYARRQGLTSAEYLDLSYRKQLALYQEDRAKGVPDCEFWVRKRCVVEPRYGVTFARGTKLTWDERFEGARRAIMDLTPLIFPLVGAASIALLIVYIIPFLVLGVWSWLTAV